MKTEILLIGLILLAFLFSGCTEPNKDNGINQALDNEDGTILNPTDFPDNTANEPVKFEIVEPLPAATVNQEYNYSFCKPDLNSVSELCDGNEITNPTRGNPPYHFVLDSGAFAPMGLSLNLNGLLKGIPANAGESTFSVCAVDLSGTQSCKQVTLVIAEAAAVPETWAGKMTGTHTIDDFLGGGKYGYDFTVSFTVPKSIIATYNDPENSDLRFGLEETSGTISETTTILQQTDTASHPDNLLVGGSITEPIRVINGAHYDSPHTIQIHSPSGKELIGGYWQRTNLPPLDAHWGDLVLTVTDYTNTTIAGTWGTVDYGELKAHGTFTFNKQ